MTNPFRQTQRTPFAKVMLNTCCSTSELAKFLFNKSTSDEIDLIDSWLEGSLTPDLKTQEKISTYLNVPKYVMWPWVWDFNDLEDRLESLRLLLLQTHYKEPRFTELCRQLSAVELKMYIRNRRETKSRNVYEQDPYILPTYLNKQ